MKMAKPSQVDIDAAGDLMSILTDIDKGYYPERGAKEGAPTWFDEEDPEHLRAFYDAVKATLERGPGYPGRVIGGMCYVIMWEKNEIVDPESDTIDLHPRLVKALEAAESAADQARWISVDERLPEGECLAVYVTPNGKRRLIRAKYARQLQIEAQGDDNCETEYNEDDDTFYLKAGWLECIDNWGEYSSCYVTEGTVTHWMPLPPAPVALKASKESGQSIEGDQASGSGK